MVITDFDGSSYHEMSMSLYTYPCQNHVNGQATIGLSLKVLAQVAWQRSQFAMFWDILERGRERHVYMCIYIYIHVYIYISICSYIIYIYICMYVLYMLSILRFCHHACASNSKLWSRLCRPRLHESVPWPGKWCAPPWTSHSPVESVKVW